MRIFETFPQGHVCPVCGDSTNEPSLLVPIHGTEDGHNMEAIPTHLGCILENVRYSREHQLIGLEAKEVPSEPSEY